MIRANADMGYESDVSYKVTIFQTLVSLRLIARVFFARRSRGRYFLSL